MFYAIIMNTVASSASSVSASYTGVVYDYMNDNIVKAHKDQGFFIQPMSTAIAPINQAELFEYEILTASSTAAPTAAQPVPIYREITKSDAVDAVKFYVNERKKEENMKLFTYTHSVSGDHQYYADVESIQATQNQCLTMADTDPIPTANGKWKTAEFEADGVTPVYVSFTVAEFKNMAKSLFDRGASNFANKELHYQTLNSMVNDSNVTVEDIFNYDYSQGWV